MDVKLGQTFREEQIETIWQQGAEENTGAQGRGNVNRLEKTG
jgi:hypothetical protein